MAAIVETKKQWKSSNARVSVARREVQEARVAVVDYTILTLLLKRQHNQDLVEPELNL